MGAPRADWRDVLADEIDPDDELIETPPDVIMMLGYDPAADPDFNSDATHIRAAE